MRQDGADSRAAGERESSDDEEVGAASTAAEAVGGEATATAVSWEPFSMWSTIAAGSTVGVAPPTGDISSRTALWQASWVPLFRAGREGEEGLAEW